MYLQSIFRPRHLGVDLLRNKQTIYVLRVQWGGT